MNCIPITLKYCVTLIVIKARVYVIEIKETNEKTHKKKKSSRVVCFDLAESRDGLATGVGTAGNGVDKRQNGRLHEVAGVVERAGAGPEPAGHQSRDRPRDRTSDRAAGSGRGETEDERVHEHLQAAGRATAAVAAAAAAAAAATLGVRATGHRRRGRARDHASDRPARDSRGQREVQRVPELDQADRVRVAEQSAGHDQRAGRQQKGGATGVELLHRRAVQAQERFWLRQDDQPGRLDQAAGGQSVRRVRGEKFERQTPASLERISFCR